MLGTGNAAATKCYNTCFDGQLHLYGHDKALQVLNDICRMTLPTKIVKQFGFRAELPDGKSVVCLGDEPYQEANQPFAEDADWLLCEAFCLYEDRERFKPYEKHHCTAKDVGEMASRLQPKHVVVYHTEDSDLAHRKVRYTAEVLELFDGEVRVPDDLEVFEL